MASRRRRGGTQRRPRDTAPTPRRAKGSGRGSRTVAVVHVALRVAGALAVRLEHADGHGDLELSDRGQIVPLLLGAHAGDVATVRREEVLARHDGEALDDEAEERGHGDAAVLDLGVAQVADGRLVAEAPEVALGDEVEGVPEACAGDAGRRAVAASLARRPLRRSTP